MKTKKRFKVIIICGLMVLSLSFVFLINRKTNSCPTDLNNDKKTDSLDLFILNEWYGKPFDQSEISPDLNKDGRVDASDIGILVSAIGQTCK